MQQRPIIDIDESKCDGCGQCVLDCAEGALAVVNGKAKLVSESFCDGLGACLHCPQGALTIITRNAAAFDEAAAMAAKAVRDGAHQSPAKPLTGQGGRLGKRSPLPSWPIQLRLVPPTAPFLRGARVLFAAHCAGFAVPTLHTDWIEGRIPIIACPKLEPKNELLEKMVNIFRQNDIAGIDILRMSVPCCGGLEHLVKEALVQSSKNVPLNVHTVATP